MLKPVHNRVNNLCEFFRMWSSAIWDGIGDAYAMNTPLYEESITQCMHLDLGRFAPNNIKFVVFNKFQERLTGGDWLWVIKSNNHYLSIYTQAKKIILRSHRYNSLRDLGNPNGQCQTLINYARNNNAWSIYTFYNHILEGCQEYAAAQNISSRSCVNSIYESVGIAYGHASLVMATYCGAQSRKSSFMNLHPVMNPLTDLFCCPCAAVGNVSPSLPHQVHMQLENTASGVDNIPEIANNQPRHVTLFDAAITARADGRHGDYRQILTELNEVAGPVRGIILLSGDME